MKSLMLCQDVLTLYGFVCFLKLDTLVFGGYIIIMLYNVDDLFLLLIYNGLFHLFWLLCLAYTFPGIKIAIPISFWFLFIWYIVFQTLTLRRCLYLSYMCLGDNIYLISRFLDPISKSVFIYWCIEAIHI